MMPPIAHPEMVCHIRSLARGSWPTNIGLNRSMIRLGSLPSPLSADPRKAFPSIPWSVIILTSAIFAVLALVDTLRVYRVGGISFHSHTVTFTSVMRIFLLPSLSFVETQSNKISSHSSISLNPLSLYYVRRPKT